MTNIPFNKPFLTGKETAYIKAAVESGKISGDGIFTEKCHEFFKQHYGFENALLITSCTDALELAAILCDIEPGDEVIVPSFTFVSTANAFVLRGARIVFADSESTTPNIDTARLQELITPRTKAIVPVHYAGVACDMDHILALADKYGLMVIEDAAQAIDSYYKMRPLGSLGSMAAFSFHETKNVICGEGGMFVANHKALMERAEIVREKGTNRAAFFRGQVDKYRWVDIGSSFLPSEIVASFLFAQLENIEVIQSKRKNIWGRYHNGLNSLQQRGIVSLPFVPDYATNNAHMFYLICGCPGQRSDLETFLRSNGIMAVSHYQSLHKSPFYAGKHGIRELPNAERYSACLLRLPLFYDLANEHVDYVINKVIDFFAQA